MATSGGEERWMKNVAAGKTSAAISDAMETVRVAR